MRCIPEKPEFGEGLHAERAVWERLRAALPDEVILAHSVHVRNGTRQHEIDILVLWPGVGMAAIEVKGGQVSVDRGTWYQSGKTQRHEIKSPVAQCQGAVHAFKKWAGIHLGTPVSSRFVYMVALPYTDLPSDWTMAGCPRSLFLDRAQCHNPAELLRRAIETEGDGVIPLVASYAERIARLLEGNLPEGNDPTAPLQELEDKQEYLTEQQSVLLRATRSLPRVQFTGGAGSGKTWLAVEKAKMLSKEGKKVGLFCYNRGLGQYLRDRVATWRQAKPVYTGEFHEFAKLHGVPDGVGQDYFDVSMPAQLKNLAASIPFEQKLDVVIVDEAQDFAELWWEALLACAKDPHTAEIYAFMDNQQDVYRRWNGASNATPGSPTAGLVTINVDDNLRNTRKIAESFKSFAGEFFTPRGGTGLPVRLVTCSTDDALNVASDCVDALIDEGWSNNQIALLTTKGRHPIHQDFQDRDALGEYWEQFHADQEEFYGHVLGFKGLERSVVVLCVNGFKDMERAREQLYVGMSRARSLLVVVGDPRLLAEAGGNALSRALDQAQCWRPDTR